MLMKRMLLLAVRAGIAAGTAGCKQQDAPKLDRQAVRLYVGDQVRITADRPVAWSAADDFYAAVDADGTVTARHVGTTTVTATADSGSAVCTVEVQPRYDTFEEPLYNYLSLHPLSVLKEAETREILEQNDKEIVYKGVAPLEKISYSIVWQDEMPFVLNAVAYISSVAYLDECIAFMDERYERRDEGEQGEDAIWAFYYNNAGYLLAYIAYTHTTAPYLWIVYPAIAENVPTFNK